jgi:DNA processing protein
MAYGMGRELARAGVVVVSGLARGIDAAAHRGAVDAGGVSVAVFGAGFDHVVPVHNRGLARRMLKRGAWFSEYPPGAPPRPYRFVERNRLIATYTCGTVVVEAGEKSGALITAGLAADANRELWAVPGDPRRPVSRGTNRLLRDGAGVVLDAADVLAALGLVGAAGVGTGDPPPGLDGTEQKIWRCLVAHGPADLERMARGTGVPVARLLEAVSLLELSGHVRREPEGYVAVTAR